ncbi:MAG: hypothetical protein WKG01_33805 [Kofleriaceae bacterium]
MRSLSSPLALTCIASVISLAACGDDEQPTGNPARLWLAPDMVETAVKLQAFEPPPF